MGEVYRARDLRLDREVAIKILPPQLTGDPSRFAGFEREAKSVAALAHPNILVVHDFGCQKGVAFVVTELLEGQTLRERLRASNLGCRRALELAAAVADGLAASHGKGIIHRDVKPENIFLTSDGRVKILDFGVAQVREPAPPSKLAETVVKGNDQTDVGVVTGTLNYLSPEQIRGGPLDARSDIFSLGCVLFEMLTGKRPFARPAPADTVAAILRDDLPEMSELGMEVPQEVERLVRRCLEKSPEVRFQTARDLAFALGAAATQPAPARKASAPRRWVLALVAGAVFLVAAAVLLAWYLRPQTSVPAAAPAAPPAAVEAVAVLPFTNAGGDRALDYLSDEFADSLSYRLSQMRAVKVRPSTATTRYRGPDVSLRDVARALEVQALITGRFWMHGSECKVAVELIDTQANNQLWGRQVSRKLPEVLPLPDDIVLPLAQALRPDLDAGQGGWLARHYTDNPEASQLYLMGRYYWNQRTPDSMRRAVESFRRAAAKDPRFALPHAGLADCFVTFTWLDLQRPLALYPQARAEAVRALELDDSLAEAHAALAFVTGCSDWDWAAAERGLQRALELNPNYATGHQWYSRLLSALCRHREAVAEARQAMRLDPSSPIVQTNLVAILFRAGELEEALRLGQEAVRANPHFPIAHIWLGDVYQGLGRQREALAELQEAVKTFRGQRLLATIAWFHGTMGERKEADKILADLLHQKSEGRYVSAASLAGIYVGLGKTDQAFASLEEATGERDPWLVDLQVESTYSSLHSDPRFLQLRDRMHFPAHAETSASPRK
jgi:serine/threonine-protein kinase